MKIITLFLIIFAISCSLPKLGLERQDLVGQPVRTDGVYYNRPDFWNFILYNNGVVLGGEQLHQRNLDFLPARWQDSSARKQDMVLPYNWGLFRVTGDSITIEMWASREWSKYATRIYGGRVLNDSTILLHDTGTRTDTFHLYHLVPKPDSTNRFTIHE